MTAASIVAPYRITIARSRNFASCGAISMNSHHVVAKTLILNIVHMLHLELVYYNRAQTAFNNPETLMAAQPVITFTMNPAVDLFGETQEIFDDSKSRCVQTALIPGGVGINVARNMRRMGSDTIAVFPAGGPNGHYLAQLLDEDGQRHIAIPTTAHTRQNFAITDTSREVMHHFVFPGPTLTDTELQACRDALLNHSQKLLVLSGSLPDNVPPTFYAEVTETVNKNGCKVLLDTSGIALSETLFRGAYLAKLNRKEFSSLG